MKYLKIVLLIIFVSACVIYGLLFFVYNNGKACTCYGMDIGSKCIGIRSMRTGLGDLIIPVQDEDVFSCDAIKTNDTLKLNFETCMNCSDHIYVAFGSTSYQMSASKGDYCRLNYGGEVENPNWDGKLDFSCTIPRKLGVVAFKIGNTGVDFSPISRYCK